MVDKWRIELAAARGAIDDAETEANAWSDLEVALTTALSAAVQAVATGGPKTAAKLADIQTDPFEIDLLGARQHIQSAVDGTRNAITAYDHGDEQMAAQYQNGIDR